MKVVLINGSPKSRKSVSERIIAVLGEKLSDVQECAICNVTNQDAQEIMTALQNADALVFVFPLYVDALPSRLVKFLDESQNEIALAAPRAKVYAVVNNGFYEARQNTIALSIMKNFCEHTGLSWGCGIGVGAGGMIYASPVGRGPMKNLGRAFDLLAGNIQRLETVEDYFVEPNFPRFLYMLGGNRMWKKAAKKRGLSVKDLLSY